MTEFVFIVLKDSKLLYAHVRRGSRKMENFNCLIRFNSFRLIFNLECIYAIYGYSSKLRK